MAKSAEYWKKRYEILENASNSIGKETAASVMEAYDSALRQTNSKLAAWLGRLADNNGVSLEAARRLLDANELEEFHWDVNEYIRKGKKLDLDAKTIKQLENASAKWHISRLEAVDFYIRQLAEQAAAAENRSITTMAGKVYSDQYYHSLYEVEKGIGIGVNVAAVSNDTLAKLISKPWTADNKTFSNRIWESKEKMIDTLHKDLIRTLVTGSAPDAAIKSMEKYVSSTYKNARYVAGRLVMTEQAYFHSRASYDSFRELGVEEYELVATLDSHTSEICRQMDGKHFPMSQYEVSVTAPPFHPFCRTVTVPYFENNYGVGTTRAARDPETGKTVQVPRGMTYQEWKKAFVDGDKSGYEKQAKSDIIVDMNETQKITKKDHASEYGVVDRDFVNSKRFHDAFEELPISKAAQESAYQNSMAMLEHRDGQSLEDLYAIDARTGTEIFSVLDSIAPGKVEITENQYNMLTDEDRAIYLLHNHPGCGRLSYKDLTKLQLPAVKGVIATGHDGSLFYADNLDPNFDIDGFWDRVYNDYKKETQDKVLAEQKALDALYGLGAFRSLKKGGS